MPHNPMLFCVQEAGCRHERAAIILSRACRRHARLRRGKKNKKQSRDCPCSGKLFKVSSGTGCFPIFGGDIKVGGVLKRLPAHSDSFPTILKRIIRLSGVSFKDTSISSNFKSHPKRMFLKQKKEPTKRGRWTAAMLRQVER